MRCIIIISKMGNEKHNKLIICPNSYKIKMLEGFSHDKKLVNVKFITLEEYRKNYYFDYGIDAIKYLKDKGLSVLNAKEILDNLVYINKEKYENLKLDRLAEYKRELDTKGMLIYNPLFKKYLESVDIEVRGYGELSKFDLLSIKGNIIPFAEKEVSYVVSECENIEEEVELLYASIKDDLKNDVDINNIYVLNNSDEYESYIKRYNTYFGFKIECNNPDTLYGTVLGKEFIKKIDICSREEIFEWLNSLDNDLGFIPILNKYAGYDLRSVKELIVEDLKNKKVRKDNYRNIVKNGDFNRVYSDDEIVYLIGFNDKFPILKRDIEYINDDIRELVDLEKIEDENRRIKRNMKAYLSTIKNLNLSYSKTSPFNVYNRQVLVDATYNDKHLDVVNLSEGLNKYKYATALDKLNKYNTQNDKLGIYMGNYQKNDYLSYDNNFDSLDFNQLPEKVTLSYTSMNAFYECKFKYYLDSIVGLKDPNGNFNSKMGTVCHGVLQDYYETKPFDFETSWNKYMSKEELEGEVEEYFKEKIKEELRKDIEIIKRQGESSTFNNVKCENQVNVEVAHNIVFKGFIDKLLYKKDGSDTYVSIVDYKTGNSVKINEKVMKDGLSLQLPSYLYLMRNNKDFSNVKFAGFYLQHIINKITKYEDGKTIEDVKNESMKLEGFSSCDLDRLKAFDTSLYSDDISSNIKSIKLKKDGSLSANAKVMSDERMEELVKLVERKVIDAGSDILRGDFKINPKVSGTDNLSCKYCPYKGICYKRNENIEYLESE